MHALNEIMTRHARIIGDHPYLITEARHWSYAEFAARAARLAAVLAARGVAKGAPVGLYSADNLTMATGYWACQKLGAVPTPMSAAYRAAELRNVLGRTGMRLVLADAGLRAHLAEAGLDGAHVLQAGASLEAAIAAAPADMPDAFCAPDDVACLFFTSGTSGTPKGTMQTQLSQYSTLRDMMVGHGSRFATEVYLCATPAFTNLGATVNLHTAAFTGGAVVLHDRWETRRALDAIRQHRVTMFTGMPTMFLYMLNMFDPARDDLSSLRLCLVGGAPVSPAMVERFEAASGARLIQVYGATESTGQVVMEPVIGLRRRGSSGVPLGSTRIAIIDAAGTPLPPATVGEIVIGGDCLAAGYWNDPAATAASFGPLGWRSGDAGYLDADGYLFVVDRIKDVIISGGHNIYPLEVEEVLYAHPAVAVCAVLPVADALRGEIPVAVIVAAPGAAPDAPALAAWCADRLAAYKLPRAFYAIDDMPLGAGKIRKRELAEMIRDGRLQRMGGGAA